MKWKKETRSYMWANYFSEDGKWKAWDEDRTIPQGSNRKWYNPETHKFEKKDKTIHYWKLENLITGEEVEQEFKTLRDAKAYAEANPDCRIADMETNPDYDADDYDGTMGLFDRITRKNERIEE